MRFEALSEGHRFLEAPKVDERGNLYFTALVEGGIHQRAPDGTMKRLMASRRWMGGLALNDDGGLIASGLGGIAYFNERTGVERPLLTQINGQPIVAVNDLFADAHGSLYGGTVDFASIEQRKRPTPGVLFRLDPSGALTVLRENVFVSNGIGSSPDGKHLYHSETSIGVWAYDLDDRRNVIRQTMFVEMKDSDGLAVDSTGVVWVAGLASGKLHRFAPDGSTLPSIELPMKEVVSLTFGGADLKDLYVVGGGDIYDPEQRRAAVYRARSAVAGQPTHRARFRIE